MRRQLFYAANTGAAACSRDSDYATTMTPKKHQHSHTIIHQALVRMRSASGFQSVIALMVT
jgi:hypothetical protein